MGILGDLVHIAAKTVHAHSHSEDIMKKGLESELNLEQKLDSAGDSP
jgi:hypothetical protein